MDLNKPRLRPACSLLTMSLLAVACIAPPRLAASEHAPSSPGSASTSALDFELLLQLRSRIQGNVALSPASLSAALGVALEGARRETATEIAKAIDTSTRSGETPPGSTLSGKLSQETGSACKFSSTNAVWLQRGFDAKSAFLGSVRSKFWAYITAADFTNSGVAAREMNVWIADQTQRRVPCLLEPSLITPQTDLVIVNASYFSGSWAAPIHTERTTSSPFRLTSGATVTVPTMNVDSIFRYFETPTFQALEMAFADLSGFPAEMPFASNRFSMIVLLPKGDDKLEGFERMLSSRTVEQICRDGRIQTVRVSLPRFECQGVASLRGPLRNLGIRRAFSPGEADFSGITEKSVFLDDVIQSVWVRTDEKGVEAASATAALLVHGTPDEETPSFRADHAFVFLIRHNPTGAILFLGHVLNPQS